MTKNKKEKEDVYEPDLKVEYLLLKLLTEDPLFQKLVFNDFEENKGSENHESKRQRSVKGL